MNPFIIEQKEFQILALCRRFRCADAAVLIPEFWKEYYANGNGEYACGEFGVSFDYLPDGTFRYGIGNLCEVERLDSESVVYHISNCRVRMELPPGFELLTIPAGLWAKFECIGPLPHAVQSMLPRIYGEWFPDSGYEKSAGFDLERYLPGDTQLPDYSSFICLPIRKAGK